MKYFIDTEFHEYPKQQKCFGIKIGKPIPTIDLISIGIVSEDISTSFEKRDKNGIQTVGRDFKQKEYYAICKDFDTKAAWNNEWLRENVLKSIWKEFQDSEVAEFTNRLHKGISSQYDSSMFNYKSFKYIINKYGETRKQIAEKILEFVGWKQGGFNITSNNSCEAAIKHYDLKEVKPNMFLPQPEFYAYYADYDWVVFCWLFGRMGDLPKGFPMYCKDLKQMLDEKVENLGGYGKVKLRTLSINEKLNFLKDVDKYPKQENEHNALNDAKWNKKLYKFIKTNL